MAFMFAHRRRGYPLHDAAESGDLVAINDLLHPPLPPAPTAAAEGGEANGDGEMMQVDDKEEDAEGSKEGGEGDEEGGEEEEEEEESVASEDDESYQASGAEDDEAGMDEDEDSDAEVGMPSQMPRRLPAVDVNSRDNEDCTALHVAIHARQLEAARLLLKENADVVRTTEKSTVLHTAVSLAAFPAHRDFTLQAIELLTEYKAEIDAKDDNLQTPLHLAAHIGHEDTIQALLDKGATESLAGRDRYKQAPLHLAAKAGHLGSVRLLLTAGADPLLRDFYGRTALHMASRNGHWDVVEEMLASEKGADMAKVKDKQGLTAGDLAVKRGVSVPMRLAEGLGIESPPTEEPVAPPTLLVTDAACLEHHTCPPPINRSSLNEPPPENANRLKVLLNDATGSLRSAEFDSCEWLEEAQPAALADLLKCHELHYLERVKQTCLALDREEEELGQLDGDTTISNGTWEAALRAAGATCMAVDRVVEGKNKNAFCAVRPPGHHAGSRGVVTDDPSSGSHGFCIINNVAVAAAYARSMYRHKGIRRIAIVDFDVHHGNGTEEIVENLVPRTEEHTARLPWADEVTYSHIKYLPWLNEDDAKETLFISVHGYSGSFYPGSGRTRIPPVDGFVEEEKDDDTEDEDPYNGKPPVQVLDVGMRRVVGQDVLPGQNRVEWRTTMRETVLPRLAAFSPDLILISAGFDAHRRDTINHGFIGLVEEDYEWITDYLVRIANKSCEGRVVSVLEGGYRIQGGVVSPFARSVAAHVRSLVTGRTSREAFESSDLEWEHAYEKRMQDERLKKIIEQKAALEAAREVARDAALKAAREEAAATEAATVSSEHDTTVTSVAPAETDAPSTATEEPGGRRSKRKAAVPVDYVALAKKMKEEEAAAAEAAKGGST